MRTKIIYSKLIQLLFFLILIYSCKPARAQTISNTAYVLLHDGRKLSYREYGQPDGEPVFYFHGFPSSGIEVMLNDGGQIAKKLNIRIIAVNRPGYGISDYKPERTLLDWPDDITELADSLGIDTFSVLGVSGGGPYVLACAYKIPDRIRKAGVVCGVGPYDAPGAKDGASAPILKSPRFIRKYILKGFKKAIVKNPEKVTRKMHKRFPEADQDVISISSERDVLLNAIAEGLSAGPDGALQDAEIYKNYWGFDLVDVKKQIFLWHGEVDLSVPIETGKYVAEKLQNCMPTFYSGEGHFSILYNKSSEIYGLYMTEKKH